MNSVWFQGAISQIQDSAFESCYKLTKVELTRNAVVERIGRAAFYGCSKMTFTSDVSVTLGDEILIGCSYSKVILSKGTVVPDGGFRRQYYGVEGNGIEIVWV